MSNFNVSVFYKVTGLDGLVFHEDIPVQMGSQVNAETKDYVDENFKRRVENECNFFRRADGLPELDCQIIDKKVFQDTDTAFRVEEILTEQQIKKDKEEKEYQEKRKKELKRIKERELKEREKWESFLSKLNNKELENYIRKHCVNRSDLTSLSFEYFYSAGFSYSEVEKLKSCLRLNEVNAMMKRTSISPIRQAWIDSEIHKSSGEDEKKTKDFLNSLDLLTMQKEAFKKNESFLPEYISGFKYYPAKLILDFDGIGPGTIERMRIKLSENDIAFKDENEKKSVNEPVVNFVPPNIKGKKYQEILERLNNLNVEKMGGLSFD